MRVVQKSGLSRALSRQHADEVSLFLVRRAFADGDIGISPACRRALARLMVSANPAIKRQAEALFARVVALGRGPDDDNAA